MPGPGHQQAAMLHRRTVVADRYIRGQSMHAIAAQLEISVSTVHSDITAIRQQWKDSAAHEFADELAKIDNLESEYWKAWESSKPAPKKTKSDQSPKPRHDGDPAFLAGVMSCIERRCKLLGLDKVKAAMTGVIVNIGTITDDPRIIELDNAIMALESTRPGTAIAGGTGETGDERPMDDGPTPGPPES